MRILLVTRLGQIVHDVRHAHRLQGFIESQNLLYTRLNADAFRHLKQDDSPPVSRNTETSEHFMFEIEAATFLPNSYLSEILDHLFPQCVAAGQAFLHDRLVGRLLGKLGEGLERVPAHNTARVLQQ